MLIDADFRLVEGTPERCPLGARSEDVQAWEACHGQKILQFGTEDLPLFRHAATQKRVLGYLRTCIQKGATLPLVDLIQRALKCFGLERSERMVRYYINAAKADRNLYIFRSRCGRSFVLFFRSSTRKPSTNTPKKVGQNSPCNAYYIGSLKGVELNAGVASGSSKLRNFAFAIARVCLERHWDNCKVSQDLRHAFKYCLHWLRAGRMSHRIIDAYDVALHQRHKDATDAGLNQGCPVSVRWCPSSTVALASSMLAQEEAPEVFSALMGVDLV